MLPRIKLLKPKYIIPIFVVRDAPIMHPIPTNKNRNAHNELMSRLFFILCNILVH